MSAALALKEKGPGLVPAVRRPLLYLAACRGADGRVVTYDETGGKISEKDGHLKQQTDGIGRSTTYDYDGNGNLTTATDNAGNATRTDYDELNRPVRVVGPVYTDTTPEARGTIRPVTTYIYNPLGHVTEVWAGHIPTLSGATGADALSRQMTYVSDDFGRGSVILSV